MKYINVSTDDELKGKINQIRILLTKLRNTLTNEKKNIIKDELYKIENKERLAKSQKERRLTFLIDLLRYLDNKYKHLHNDYHDLDYFGLRDIEHLFTTINPSEYYKPILVRTAFKNNYSEYEIRGDKDKNKSMQHYLYTIIPFLKNLIDERKAKTQNEQKVQLTICVKFNHTTDPTKARIFYVKSKSIVITQWASLVRGTSIGRLY